MASTKEDTSNFFKRTDYNEDYWTNYLAARPHYSRPSYQSIYAYHRSHNGLFKTAHDIGTGPGQVAAELSDHFDHVIASDVNLAHLDVAEHRLGSLVSSHKVDLIQCSAEEIANTHPPSSGDLIVAAECLPLMDASKALKSFNNVLKPKGTLAIWFYGRPIFAEPDYADKCQLILDSILDLSFAPFIKGGGPQYKAGWKRATDRMASFLDDVEFQGDLWRNVERRKWNSKHAMPFYGPEACDFGIEVSSAVRVEEKAVEIEDAAFWERSCDLAGVRRFVSVNLPSFNEGSRDERLESKYEELEQAMGGGDAVRKITWPVVLILASKKYA